MLGEAKKIDFEAEFYGVQSKVRARIKNTLLVSSGLKEVNELRCSDEGKKYLTGLLMDINAQT